MQRSIRAKASFENRLASKSSSAGVMQPIGWIGAQCASESAADVQVIAGRACVGVGALDFCDRQVLGECRRRLLATDVVEDVAERDVGAEAALLKAGAEHFAFVASFAYINVSQFCFVDFEPLSPAPIFENLSTTALSSNLSSASLSCFAALFFVVLVMTLWRAGSRKRQTTR